MKYTYIPQPSKPTKRKPNTCMRISLQQQQKSADGRWQKDVKIKINYLFPEKKL